MFWDALIRFGQEKMEREENAIILGDFNTGLNTVDKEPGAGDFYLSACMQAFKELHDAKGRKWVDAWRKFHRKPSQVDYTWYMPGGEGFRLDYAFLSPTLGDKLKAARYSPLERESGLSDHSMLIVETNCLTIQRTIEMIRSSAISCGMASGCYDYEVSKADSLSSGI